MLKRLCRKYIIYDHPDCELTFKFSCNNCIHKCAKNESLNFCKNYVPHPLFKKLIETYCVHEGTFDRCLQSTFDSWGYHHD